MCISYWISYVCSSDRDPPLLPDLSAASKPVGIASAIEMLRSAISHAREMRQFVSDRMEQLPDATIVSDVNGAVTLSNAAAAKLFDDLSASPDDRLSLPHILQPFRNAKNRAPMVVPQGVSGDQLD